MSNAPIVAASEGPARFPTARDHLFDPPPELARLRERSPVVRLRFPSGELGWLVTGYSATRRILADPSFHKSQVNPFPGGHGEVFETPPPGVLSAMDPPDHTRLRRQVAGDWTLKKMAALSPLVEEIVEERLGAMASSTEPIDLLRDFALPIPSIVICKILGVPVEWEADFHRMSYTMVAADVTAADVAEALAGLQGILYRVIERKRRDPADDLMTKLVQDGELTDEEMANLGWLLLVAGHETTANMLTIGTLALLAHPDQWEALVEDPALVDGAVEELLRYLCIFMYVGVKATKDVELEGEIIRAGESVAISLPAACRDPQEFDRPDVLDIRRENPHHVTFSHGTHSCLGQHLARIEMRIGLRKLAERFPNLRVAVPIEQLDAKTDMRVYGLHALPVELGERPAVAGLRNVSEGRAHG